MTQGAKLGIVGMNEDWDRGNFQAEVPGEPWESGENEWKQGPWNSSSGRPRSRGGEPWNQVCGNRAGAGAWDTGRTTAERAHGGKENKKIKMLGQHNILRFAKELEYSCVYRRLS